MHLAVWIDKLRNNIFHDKHGGVLLHQMEEIDLLHCKQLLWNTWIEIKSLDTKLHSFPFLKMCLSVISPAFTNQLI